MNQDENIEQAAQVLSTLTTCDGQPHATELHRRQARALADAGLLARPLPARDEIAMDIYERTRRMSDLIFDEATSLRLPETNTADRYVWDPDGDRHDLHHEKLGDLLDTHKVLYQTPPTTHRYKVGDILETAADFDAVPIGTIIVGLREWEYRKVLPDAWNTSESFAGICLNREFVKNDLNWKYPGPGHWEVIYLPATYTGKERESFLSSYPAEKEARA